MLVRRDGVDVPRHPRNGARGDSAFCEFVALVATVRGHGSATVVAVGSIAIEGEDQFATIDDRAKIQVFRIDAKPALREQ